MSGKLCSDRGGRDQIGSEENHALGEGFLAELYLRELNIRKGCSLIVQERTDA